MFSQLFWIYRKCAEKRGIQFFLTREEFDSLIQQACYICGKRKSNRRVSGKTGAVLRYNGIDRVDNSLGYFMGNVLPCCRTCNEVKGRMSLGELKAHIQRMLKRGLHDV